MMTSVGRRSPTTRGGAGVPVSSSAGNPTIAMSTVSAATGSRSSASLVMKASGSSSRIAPTKLRRLTAPQLKPTAKPKPAPSDSSTLTEGAGRLPNGGYRKPVLTAPPQPSNDIPVAQAQMLAARFNAASEMNELRTLLKLPQDTPSAQVIHKLREAFHLMNIVERFRADLGRVLHTKEARTAEGALRAVQELLRENEQLRQQAERQQDIITKLQEDRRDVLERFHRLIKEHHVQDYGSGSLIALPSPAADSSFPSTNQGISRTATAVVSVTNPAGSVNRAGTFGELGVSRAGEPRDLATMLSSRIDHLLVPKAKQNAPVTEQQKELSPIYIRRKKNKDEKKMVYKITGILRPVSSASSTSRGGAVQPSAVPAITSSMPTIHKLPEIVARRQTSSLTHKVKMLAEGESIMQSTSSLLSRTGTATTPASASEASAPTDVPPQQAPKTQVMQVVQGNQEDHRHTKNNSVSMSKRYSSMALSTAGSVRQVTKPMATPPSLAHEPDESIGDFFGSISDVKKDDLISLIFAPLLKDRYLSRFTISPQGGVLSVPEVGLALVVPEGALPVGTGSMDIMLGVSYNPADKPSVGDGHTVTSPTVLCATCPARVTFQHPVMLAFAHSGNGPMLTKCKTTMHILHSLTDIGHATKWEKFEMPEDSDSEDEFGCVTGDRCIVFLSRLRLFSLAAEQGTGGRVATKYVRMVVFVSYSPGRDSVALNVYCTDSLPSERQLLRRECLLDGTGVEVGEQPMVMYANTGDLIVSVRNLPHGWQLNGVSHQSISYRKAWYNLHPHVTFVLECAPDTWESEITCSVHAQQLNTNDSDAAVDIHVCCDLAQIEGCSDGSLFDHSTGASGLRSFLRGQTSDFFTPSVFDAAASLLLQDVDTESVSEDVRTLLLHAAWPRQVRDHHMPAELIHQLAAMLDPPNLLGLDWRQLSAELNLDSAVPHLTGIQWPTAHLLAAAEVLCAGTYELESVLKRMRRDDAAGLVRAYRAHVRVDGPGDDHCGGVNLGQGRAGFTARF